METVVDYRAAEAAEPPERRRGWSAATFTLVSSVGIVCLSHHFRMAMVQSSAEWCGNPRMNAESNLWATGLLLVAPAVGAWVSWAAKAGFALARTSVAVGMVGWVFYVVSTAVGLAI